MGKLSLVEKIMVIAEAKNFSDLEKDGMAFDRSDEGIEEEQLYSQLSVESLLVQLLSKLDDRKKIILLLQLLKDSGYNLTKDDCAKTLSISKHIYTTLENQVRDRARKVLLENS